VRNVSFRDPEGRIAMAYIEKSVRVDKPVRVVYDQWTQFEEFPRFMEGVKEVRQLDERHLHWRAEIAGKEEEWDAEITHQEPDARISWRNTSGPYNAGLVTFQPDGGGTRVTLRIDYEPQGLIEKIGDALGFVSRRVEGDLERFKRFIEQRDDSTGAWRGEINVHPHMGQL
jgi:uncharacterized membrane protein